MSKLLEIITGRVDAPDVTFTPLTANSPDNFIVRDFDIKTSKAYLLNVVPMLGDQNGVLRIRSPHFHDMINGLQFPGGNGNQRMIPMSSFFTELYPGDRLEIEATGSIGAFDAWALIIYYENAYGFNARYLDYEFIKKYKKRVFNACQSTFFSIAGSADYEQPIEAQLKSFISALEYDRYYAILGTGSNSPLTVFGGLKSPEWGNVNYPICANSIYPYTDWTRWLTERTGVGLIPFFHSESIGAIVTSLINCTNGSGNMNFALTLVELTQEANPLIEQMGEQIPTSRDRSKSQ